MMSIESNILSGSTFIPTISGGIIKKRRQHYNRKGTCVRNRLTSVDLQVLTQLKG